jgi:16S rRNA (guanine527-N7)-methyltransferase
MCEKAGHLVLSPDQLAQTERAAYIQLRDMMNVSRETLDALEAYRILLTKWAGQINLVGPSTLAHFWERHALDSAQLLPIFGDNVSSLVDFGSGAGLPGLIVARLLKDHMPTSHVTLVELSAKRCGFLREAARTLGVSVTILQKPLETVVVSKVDVVTARAFAPLEKLLAYAHPWAQLGSRIVFLKGGDVQSEINQASTNWSFQSRLTKSLTDSRGCILEILDLQPNEGNTL